MTAKKTTETGDKKTTDVDKDKTAKAHGAAKDKTTGTTQTTSTKDGEVTVHVDTSTQDHDPSNEMPAARHVEGTGGVVGTAAGSFQERVVPTGNAENKHPTEDPHAPQGPDKEDIRDLRPKEVEKREKQEGKSQSTDYAAEIDGNVTDELNLADAAKAVYNGMIAGASSGIINRKGKRFVLFTTEELQGQKHLVLKPEDGTIKDEEAAVLNDYNHRVLAGHIN